jgi:radical SAM superfamily enzyme YgiQ (UPF0313 family)
VTLVYPDTYEIGASNFGLEVVRHLLLRSGRFDVRRAYHPAPDMLALHREEGVPWVDLERGEPVSESSVVGFSVASELLYTNVLSLIDLMGLPLRSADRPGDSPVVLAGGGGISNPVPLMPFVDVFFLGEAEDGAVELMSALAREGSREDRLRAAAGIRGVLVPGITRGRVRLARARSLEDSPAPVRQIVPTASVVQERAVVEISRGCTRGCRFCQATQLARPVRERTPGSVEALMRESLRDTGFEEGGVVSLSYSDYSMIGELSRRLGAVEAEMAVRVSQPSLRPDTLKRMAGSGRRLKGHVTLAPEAGTLELRRRIGKPFTDEEILEAVSSSRSMGASGVKMYFMVGLPWETDEDLRAISSLAERASAAGGRRWQVTAALSPFVPKPHTPFQWVAQRSPEEVRRRIRLVRSGCRRAKVSWNDPEAAAVEAALAMAGPGFSEILEQAFRQGAVFDAWNDMMRKDVWFPLLGTCPTRVPGPGDPLPWDMVDTGVRRDWLEEEYRRAGEGLSTPDCRDQGCTRCGACLGDVPPLPGDAPVVPGPEDSRADVPEARLRVRYSREGLARFTSHLDAVRMWGRAVRRAGVPVCMGAGFVRRPALKFGHPLPLGMASRAEYVDLFLRSPVDPREAAALLDVVLPEGFRVLAAGLIPLQAPAPDSGGFLEYNISGAETAILRGTPGILNAGGERVLTDPSGGAVRLDRLMEGVPHGVITRTEVYTSREDGKTVPLLRISEGD